MGHYDDCYEADEKKARARRRKEEAPYRKLFGVIKDLPLGKFTVSDLEVMLRLFSVLSDSMDEKPTAKEMAELEKRAREINFQKEALEEIGKTVKALEENFRPFTKVGKTR